MPPCRSYGKYMFFIDLGDFGALGVTLGDLGVTWGAPDALMLSIIRKYSFLFYYFYRSALHTLFRGPFSLLEIQHNLSMLASCDLRDALLMILGVTWGVPG